MLFTFICLFESFFFIGCALLGSALFRLVGGVGRVGPKVFSNFSEALSFPLLLPPPNAPENALADLTTQPGGSLRLCLYLFLLLTVSDS